MKIGYVSSNPNFAERTLKHLDEVRGHNIIRFQWPGWDNQQSIWYQLGQVVTQADLIWADWAQPPTDLVLGNFTGPIVVKAHRIEMYLAAAVAYNWAACDCLVFPAEFVAERFLGNLEAPPRRVGVVRHAGIDLDVFKPAEGKRKWRPPWDIVVVGNLVPKKRIYTLIQMFADLPKSFRLHVVGSGMKDSGYGNSEYPQNCTDLINSFPLEFRRRVLGLGKLPQTPDKMDDEARKSGAAESLLELYQRAHIIAAPSNEESSSCVLAEGMACGMYPAANRWRGITELYPRWATWRTPQEFHRKLVDWAALPAKEKQELSDKAQRWTRRFDGQRVDEEFAKILESPTHPVAVREYYQRYPEQGEQEEQEAVGGDKLQLLAEFSTGSSFLDVGCGRGWALDYASHNGAAAAVGQEISQEAGVVADTRTPNDVWLQDAATQGVMPGPWDTIAAFDLFQQIRPPHWTGLLHNLRLNTAEGGRLLVSFPYQDGDEGMYREPIFPKIFRKLLLEVGYTEVLFDQAIDDEKRWAIVVQKGAAT